MAHKTSLREFQEALARRIAAAASVAREDVRLGVQAGQRWWLLQLPDAGEVLSVPELTPVPLTRPWFRGMANVRGTLYSVVDLAAFTGLELSPRRRDSRLLLIGQRYGLSCALLVDRVLGLRSVRDVTLQAPAEGASWMGPEFVDREGRRWRQIDVAALLGAQDFLQVAA